MSYEVTVNCNREGCEESKQVPAVGHLPVGWMLTQQAVLVDGRPLDKPDIKVFCGWYCIHKHAGAALRLIAEAKKANGDG